MPERLENLGRLGLSTRPMFWALWCLLLIVLGASLFAGELLPLRDLPDHLALISLIDHVRVPGSVASEHYQLQLMVQLN